MLFVISISFLIGKINFKQLKIFIFTALLFLIPWMFYNFQIDSTVLPINLHTPQEIEKALELRNHNGIYITSVFDYFSYFYKLFLNIHAIPGNESIGLFYFVALISSFLTLIFPLKSKKKFNISIITLAFVIWTIVFFLWKIDGRFLTRYIFINTTFFVIIFSMYAFELETRFFKKPIVFVLIIIFITILSKSNFERFLNSNFNAFEFRAEKILKYNFMSSLINSTKKPGENLATQDSLILFLDPPIINLSAIQAEQYNLHGKTKKELLEILNNNNVKYIHKLNRITSGNSDVLDNFINEHGNKYYVFSKSTLYKLNY